MSDSYDSSIPVLNDVLVPGNPEHARAATYPTFAESGPPGLDPRMDPGAPAPTDLRGYDPEILAERLRGRFANYLTGEGRSIVEARCRDALHDHTTWLVNQITREVALALETEMTGWVREAMREEMARRAPEH